MIDKVVKFPGIFCQNQEEVHLDADELAEMLGTILDVKYDGCIREFTLDVAEALDGCKTDKDRFAALCDWAETNMNEISDQIEIECEA